MPEFISINSPLDPLFEIDFSKFSENENGFLNGKFSTFEVKFQIDKLRKSAKGLDVMSAAKMKLLPENVILSLTNVFNTIKESQQIPEEWYDCKVIAIQKCGRPGDLAENKRPISIYIL
jgi:hypothetical protein